MNWSNTIKPRTAENIIAQLVLCAVFAIGYFTYYAIEDRREDKRLDQFRQVKKYS